MTIKHFLLTTTLFSPFLFSACSSQSPYLVTANTFIPENEAFAVKKAQMDRTIDNLSITPNRKQEFKEVLNSFAETTRGHDIIAGAFSNTRFCTGQADFANAAYSYVTHNITLYDPINGNVNKSRDWYASISHELVHSYQHNHSLGLLLGISPQQYMFITKLYEAEARSLAKYGDSTWQAGRAIKQLMGVDSPNLMWTSFYEPQLMAEMKGAAAKGTLSARGNDVAIKHTLDYFKQVYGIEFDESDIQRGGLSSARIAELQTVCSQLEANGSLARGEQLLTVKQQMAEKFPQFVEGATSEKAIIQYFYGFSAIKPTHVEEAQTLLTSNNPWASVALQSLIQDGHIKGDLNQLKPQNQEQQAVLQIVRESVKTFWQLKRRQLQHTR